MILGPPSAVQVNDTVSLNWCSSIPPADGVGVITMAVMAGRNTAYRE